MRAWWCVCVYARVHVCECAGVCVFQGVWCVCVCVYAGVLFCTPLHVRVCAFVYVGVSECWDQAASISADTKAKHTQARHSLENELLEARQALQRRRQGLDPLRPTEVATAVHGTREQSVSLTHSTHNASQASSSHRIHPSSHCVRTRACV